MVPSNAKVKTQDSALKANAPQAGRLSRRGRRVVLHAPRTTRHVLATRQSPLVTPPRGFTLTEVLVAMALVAILLVGISRVFSLTSDTMRTGQAFQKALRQQKAIYSALAADFNGLGEVGQNDSGFIPIGSSDTQSARQPMLIICNYAVPTFANKAAMDSSNSGFVMPTAIPASGNDIDPNDSNKIRQNRSIYAYGEREWRDDTLSFFVRGSFQSQTNGIAGGSLISPTTANEAWVWYGHLRVFVGSDPGPSGANLNYTNYYASPGLPLTRQAGATSANNGPQTNRNNFFAEDFKLGRCAMLLVPGVRSNNTNGRYYAIDDNGKARPCIYRAWDSASDTTHESTPSPLSIGRVVGLYDGTSTVSPVTIPGHTNVNYSIEHALVDVATVTTVAFRERLAFLESSTTLGTPWFNTLFKDYGDRFYVNPYPFKPFDSAKMSQRSQLLAEGCSQFIVEFAGDYCTQDPLTGKPVLTGATSRPDGILDFAVVNGIRQTRWYGLPRDVDRDGQISGTDGPVASRGTSPDVIPVRDMTNVQLDFERTLPTTAPRANYLTNFTDTGSLTANGYVCIWGPNEMDKGEAPQLIRITVEMRDPGGALSQPVSQEYVFPVKR